MIYTVTLNPALDKSAEIPGFRRGQVNRITAIHTDPGGKGINVSKVLAVLGHQSIACGLIAGHTGENILRALEQDGIICDFDRIPGETRTNLKIYDPEDRSTTDVNEPGPAVLPEALDALRDRICAKLSAGDVLVLSGSLPSSASKDTYARWIRSAKARGAAVLADAEGEVLRQCADAAPTFLKPNADELSGLFGKQLSTEEDLIAAAKDLIASGVEKLIISRGAEGAIFVNKKEILIASSLPVTLRCTVGAGDSMVAAFASGLERGLSTEETFSLAMAVSAASVEMPGSTPPPLARVEELRSQVVLRRL